MTIQEYQIVPAFTDFLSDVRQIIDTARRQAYTAINQSMVQAYWQLGKRIVKEEQNGKVRADYGKTTLKATFQIANGRVWKGVLRESIVLL